MKPITPLVSFPEFANINPGVQPGDPKYSQGFVPSDTFPAEWANYLFNRSSKGVTTLNSATKSLWEEMNSVLESFGITPSEATNNQLLMALRLNASLVTANSTTITGPLLVPGGIIRVMFMSALAGSDITTGLTLSYNNQNIPVKVSKNGELQSFCANEINGTFKYLQKYTTLELYYDTIQFIIVGNPIVLSGADYAIHADGQGITNTIAPDNMRAVTSNAVNKRTLCLTNKKTVICVGDSYNYDGSLWTGWGTCLKDFDNYTVYSYQAPGGGFVAHAEQYSFLTALQNHAGDVAVTDKLAVSDILVLGGYNDVSVSATKAQITTAMQAFITYCEENYPNAKITVGNISIDYNNATTQRKLNEMAEVYKEVALSLGVAYYERFKYLLQNKKYILFVSGDPNSGFHPTTNGNKRVASACAEYLQNGSFEVRDAYILKEGWIYRDNGLINIMGYPVQQGYPNGGDFINSILNGKSLPFNTWVDCGSTEQDDANILWGAESFNSATFSVLVYSAGSATTIRSVVLIQIKNKKIYANNTGNTATLAMGTSYFAITPPLTFDWQEIF